MTVLPEGTDWTTNKVEDKQRTVQAHARSTSHVKQKVIKHRKGNEPWSVWDQKVRKKLTVQMLDSTQASEPPQLPVFKIKQNKTITTTIISSFISELEARNKSPKFLKLCKVRKWNKLPFFVPFQEVLHPCSSIAAVKIHRDLRSNPSQSVKSPQKAKMKLNLTTARRAEGRSARPDAPAARGCEGRRRDMPQRHASSLRTWVQGQGGGPAQTLPASTAASASGFPTPSICPRAQSPAARTALALWARGSRLQDA